MKAERWFVLVGGINGASKTTLAQSRSFLQIFGVDPGAPIEIINPDLVTQRIREQAPTSRLDEVNLRAAQVCESRVRAALGVIPLLLLPILCPGEGSIRAFDTPAWLPC